MIETEVIILGSRSLHDLPSACKNKVVTGDFPSKKKSRNDGKMFYTNGRNLTF
jgi:hypothetical protein